MFSRGFGNVKLLSPTLHHRLPAKAHISWDFNVRFLLHRKSCAWVNKEMMNVSAGTECCGAGDWLEEALLLDGTLTGAATG